MKKPLILSYKTLKKNGELNEKYKEAIECSGGVVQFLESNEEVDRLINQADGILLPGGNDVNPILYGEEMRSHTQPPHHERDVVEMYLVENAMNKKLPILGICRGLQLLNVKLGGTLYQDIYKEKEGGMRHDYHEENTEPLPRSYLAHTVSLKKSRIKDLFKKDTIAVNSLHHQGIKDLGKNLVPVTYSPDGLIEAFEMPNYPYLVGMQWHPEELYSVAESRTIFDDFIKACLK